MIFWFRWGENEKEVLRLHSCSSMLMNTPPSVGLDMPGLSSFMCFQA